MNKTVNVYGHWIGVVAIKCRDDNMCKDTFMIHKMVEKIVLRITIHGQKRVLYPNDEHICFIVS